MIVINFRFCCIYLGIKFIFELDILIIFELDILMSLLKLYKKVSIQQIIVGFVGFHLIWPNLNFSWIMFQNSHSKNPWNLESCSWKPKTKTLKSKSFEGINTFLKSKSFFQNCLKGFPEIWNCVWTYNNKALWIVFLNCCNTHNSGLSVLILKMIKLN